MKTIWFSLVAAVAFALPTWAQKVEVEKPDHGQIVHVQTSLNHLTVLEMGEPVITVALGSTAFKVEWRENKVFVEPSDTNVATNLFVWTASGRFNYELDPAGEVREMDFAIDQPPSDPPATTVASAPADPSPADLLIKARSIEPYGSFPKRNRVAVILNDSVEQDGQIYVRFTIRNQTKHVYVARTPQVSVLKSLRYRDSLYGLSHFQLSPDEESRLIFAGEAPVEVSKGELASSRLEPGKETTGIIAIKMSPQTSPTVLRLTFLADSKGVVNATLVL